MYYPASKESWNWVRATSINKDQLNDMPLFERKMQLLDNVIQNIKTC